jgi:GAF domain-containing protein
LSGYRELDRQQEAGEEEQQVEPIPETRHALGGLKDSGGANLSRLLEDMGRQVRAIVPDCVGLSITSLDGDEQLTFTLAASSVEMAMFDALQYLDGGPCEEAVSIGRTVRTDDLYEEEWRLLAEATAAKGVRSTLSFPLWKGERIIGGVNLYGASARAFVGSEDALGAILGSRAAEAVSNADLSFATRREARLTDERLEDRAQVSRAVEMLARRNKEDVETARARLESAATRAGLSHVELARLIVSGNWL